MIAKLNAYGFDYNSLKLIHSYLSNRLQRVRVNSSYSSWSEIIYGVPQGSILGPLLFNIYLGDFFMFCKESDITNYADDNSPFSCNEDIESVILKLENDSKILLTWISNNGLKANLDKFHLTLNNPDERYFIKIQNFQIFNSKCKKLLGIKIDGSLSFTEHVGELCNKSSQKLHATVWTWTINFRSSSVGCPTASGTIDPFCHLLPPKNNINSALGTPLRFSLKLH